MTRAILVTGPFEEADVKELLETLRRIERRRPQEVFELRMEGKDMTSQEIQAWVERIFPRASGVPVDIEVRKRGASPK